MDLLREYLRLIVEDAASAACRYEGTVIKSLKSVGVAGYMKRAACSDATRPDADIKIDDEVYYVEVKASSLAQMGGGSIGYSVDDKRFFPVGKNRELSETLSDLLNDINDSSLHKGLNSLLTFLSKKTRKKFDKVPVSGFNTDAWYTAVEHGMLLNINRTLEGNVSTIANHYAQKKTYYIQIAGAGLFKLSENNPAGLPVPTLNGKVKLELRLAKSGDMGRSSTGSAAGLRVQARLYTKNKSPYTLDDPESIKKMLAAIDKQ